MCIRDSVEALQEGVANNHSEAEMAGLKDRLKQFSDTLLAAGEPKTGTSVVIDWLPESGTRLTINGQVKGKDIAGEDFYRALLKIWLGNKPVQDDLKPVSYTHLDVYKRQSMIIPSLLTR